ncbi:MAG: hypothetical protein WA614_03770 [Acidimicrobiales bacterium]
MSLVASDVPGFHAVSADDETFQEPNDQGFDQAFISCAKGHPLIDHFDTGPDAKVSQVFGQGEDPYGTPVLSVASAAFGDGSVANAQVAEAELADPSFQRCWARTSDALNKQQGLTIPASPSVVNELADPDLTSLGAAFAINSNYSVLGGPSAYFQLVVTVMQQGPITVMLITLAYGEAYPTADRMSAATSIAKKMGGTPPPPPAKPTDCLSAQLLQPTVPVLSSAQVTSDVNQTVTLLSTSVDHSVLGCTWAGSLAPKPTTNAPVFAAYTVELWLTLQILTSQTSANSAFTAAQVVFGPPKSVAGLGATVVLQSGQDEVAESLTAMDGDDVFALRIGGATSGHDSSSALQSDLIAAAKQVIARLAPPTPVTPINLVGTGKGYCAHAYPARGHPLGPQIANVYACGPTPLSGDDSGPAIPEFWPTTDEGGFQCTELAIRYLYDVSGILINIDNDSPTHWDGTGKNFASDIGSYLDVAVGQHIDGQSSGKPQVGDILSEMVSPNEPRGEANDTAREYGDVGIVRSVSGNSIQLMVQNNDNSGLNTITMYSATSWGINGPSSGYYYTSFAWFTPPPPVPPVVMPTSAFKYQVTGAASVNEYSSPSSSSKVQTVLPVGNTIYLTCQRSGTDVNGSSLWDKLSNGGWISDSYTTTPNFGTFSYPIPVCITPKSWRYKVTGVSSLQERAGPSNADASVGALADQDAVNVVCQTSGTEVDGTTVWDYQVNRSYVPDAYVNAASSAGDIPQCPEVEEYLHGAT